MILFSTFYFIRLLKTKLNFLLYQKVSFYNFNSLILILNQLPPVVICGWFLKTYNI